MGFQTSALHGYQSLIFPNGKYKRLRKMSRCRNALLAESEASGIEK